MDIASLSELVALKISVNTQIIVYRRKNQKEAAQQALTVC